MEAFASDVLHRLFVFADDLHEHIQGGLPLTDLLLPDLSIPTMVQPDPGSPMMPGAFGPDELIDCWQNPFHKPSLSDCGSETLKSEKIGPNSNGSRLDLTTPQSGEKSEGEQEHTPLEQVLDEDVNWHDYDPPTILRNAPPTTARILLDIVESSIVNVENQVREETLRKRAEEDRRLAEEDVTRQREKEGKEPYLPIIIVSEQPIEEPREEPIPSRHLSVSPGPVSPTDLKVSDLPISDKTSPQPTPLVSRGTIVSILKADNTPRTSVLRRLFRRNIKHETGESSAAGSAREALRSKVEAKLKTHLDIEGAPETAEETVESLRQIGRLPEPDEHELVECVSCLDDVPRQATVKVPCHYYCLDCFERLITSCTDHEQQWPPKCCLNLIPFNTIQLHVSQRLFEIFHARAAEWDIPISERVYCHLPECGLWITPNQIHRATHQGRCTNGHRSCTLCRGALHGSGGCPEDPEMLRLIALATESGWKRCPNCQALVEHRDACQVMTCRCKTKFCYVCGLEGGYGACRCTIQQLHEIKNIAETTRRTRQMREETEERETAELQLILQQIEALEREAVERAEQRRLEQVKLENERRQREMEERVKKESIRRREMELKHEELQSGLEELHQLQVIMLEEYQTQSGLDLSMETETKMQELAEKQAADRVDMEGKVLSRITDKELTLDQDHGGRVAQEKHIEAEYLQQLQAFWRGKAGEEEGIKATMLLLQRRMDDGYRTWRQWRDEQVATYRGHLEEECTVREEIMYSVKQRMDDKYVAAKEELGRRRLAEKKWFEVVVKERKRLLAEMAHQEIEGDADHIVAQEADVAQEGGPAQEAGTWMQLDEEKN